MRPRAGKLFAARPARSRPASSQVTDPVRSAIRFGLRYVYDDMPGIRRERTGKTFRYFFPTGDSVRAPEVLGRIKSLAIPPAWTDVWICPDPSGKDFTAKDFRTWAGTVLGAMALQEFEQFDSQAQ